MIFLYKQLFFGKKIQNSKYNWLLDNLLLLIIQSHRRIQKIMTETIAFQHLPLQKAYEIMERIRKTRSCLLQVPRKYFHLNNQENQTPQQPKQKKKTISQKKSYFDQTAQNFRYIPSSWKYHPQYPQQIHPSLKLNHRSSLRFINQHIKNVQKTQIGPNSYKINRLFDLKNKDAIKKDKPIHKSQNFNHVNFHSFQVPGPGQYNPKLPENRKKFSYFGSQPYNKKKSINGKQNLKNMNQKDNETNNQLKISQKQKYFRPIAKVHDNIKQKISNSQIGPGKYLKLDDWNEHINKFSSSQFLYKGKSRSVYEK